MWICMNDCFLSIVDKECARDELLVRARRPGDIEKIFPGAQVRVDGRGDYHYRAAVKKAAIEDAMVGEVRRINYDNFKNGVRDDELHRAYMRVWTAMADLQPSAPYSGGGFLSRPLDHVLAGEVEGTGADARSEAARKKKKRRRNLKRGR